MPNIDTEEVINEALEDATLPDEPTESAEALETSEGDAPTEPVEVAPEAPSESAEVLTEQVDTPIKPEAPKVDEFEKKYGVPAQSVTGRENRIPYSRVKKITEKAINDAKKEWESTTTPKLTEFETKIKDYEGRLERVGKFEDIMVNKPDQFLQMLSSIPAYAQFFKAVETAFAVTPPKGQPQTQPAAQPTDDMPQPNRDLPDGTKVYDMEGLKALMAWNAKQVEDRVTKQFQERFGPMESQWQAEQRYQAVIPQVQAQITEARTWPLFNENEDEIVQVLNTNKKLSLEGAYRQVVFPKLSTDRDKMRQDLLKEIKQAPRATSAPSGATKSGPTSSGPRDTEDIIREAIKTMK